MDAIAKPLCSWFKKNARDLPWRRTKDPYRIWVSEIMLQQTQVATTIPYFERFVERFPTVADLAAADEADVMQLWEGLGYYRRARQLHKAAQVIVAEHEGVFPDQYDEVLALPGIGRYTAGAVLSIAHDQRLPILEANSIRVLCRLTATLGDPSQQKVRNQLWEVAESVLPESGCGEFNQALMELGSAVCTPTKPACNSCPIQANCEAFALEIQDQIPPKKSKTYDEVRHCLVVIRKPDGRVLLRKCGEDERWAGLWDFPRFDVNSEEFKQLQQEAQSKVKEQTQMDVAVSRTLTTLKHGVTRYKITLACLEAQWQAGRIRPALGEMSWVAPSKLESYPLNTTGRKVSKLL